ncbi:MAG: UvrB/UvrC motif-containing protein, partial [Bacteroidales bacterium]|nr:UvrB/UvrC motif-containing protein [Bacteroidales bacterium]
ETPQPYDHGDADVKNAAEPSEVADNAAPFRKSKERLKKELRDAQRNMQKAAKEMDFLEAAKYRDLVRQLQQQLEEW